MLIHILANHLPSKCRLTKVHAAVSKLENQLWDLSLSENNYHVFRKCLSTLLDEINYQKVTPEKEGFTYKNSLKTVRVRVHKDTIQVTQKNFNQTSSLSVKALHENGYHIEHIIIGEDIKKATIFHKDRDNVMHCELEKNKYQNSWNMVTIKRNGQEQSTSHYHYPKKLVKN